jgi:hypothetical protein
MTCLILIISHRPTQTHTDLLFGRPRPPRLSGSRWRAGIGQTKSVIPLCGKKSMRIVSEPRCKTLLSIAYDLINYLLYCSHGIQFFRGGNFARGKDTVCVCLCGSVAFDHLKSRWHCIIRDLDHHQRNVVFGLLSLAEIF